MKTKITTIIAGIFLILLAGTISADFWACFSDGDFIDFCNPLVDDRTCDSTTCMYCIDSFNEAETCYVQGSWGQCIQQGMECSLDGGGEVDGEPPILTLNSPEQGSLWISRRVLFNFTVNEESDVYYLDNMDNNPRWRRLCSDCDDYSRTKNFDDGENWVTISVTDMTGNEVLYDVRFFVDSHDPRIRSTTPRRGFASGEFEVKYTEENLESVVLHYGNEIIGMREHELTGCANGSNIYCSTTVNLSDYNHQEIEYWFVIEDIVGNIDESRSRDLDVDVTFPVVNNPEDFYILDDRYIYFNVDVTELNLDEVSYTYYDSRGTFKEKRLCSRLDDGICEKRKRFHDDYDYQSLQVLDEAGNLIAIELGL